MRELTAQRPWIRGVNIGGWLLAERFITPYFFAITTCHLRGDFCFYPNQIDAPPTNDPKHQYCDFFNCEPVLIDSAAGGKDFPTDEYTLAKAFDDKAIAKQYFEFHWEHFVTHEDVQAMHEAGVTHVRVPLPHWILGNLDETEPYVDGGWFHFIRFVNWCRKYKIQVWPDVHTAPGSQNGFDNSGQLLKDGPTCKHWSGEPKNVARSLQVVEDISNAIIKDGLQDVVTGFGILNEPFKDCDVAVTKNFNDQAFQKVRTILGTDTAVYVGDLFNATIWNTGWWSDKEHENTFLDSHYYHGKRRNFGGFLTESAGMWSIVWPSSSLSSSCSL